MSGRDAVWFDDDLEFARAARAMRPLARRPAVWAFLFAVAVATLGGVAARERIPLSTLFGNVTEKTEPQSGDFTALAVAPVELRKSVSAKKKSAKLAQRKQPLPEKVRSSRGGLLPRRTFPAWASTSRPALQPMPTPTGEAWTKAPSEPAPALAAPVSDPEPNPRPARVTRPATGVEATRFAKEHANFETPAPVYAAPSVQSSGSAEDDGASVGPDAPGAE